MQKVIIAWKEIGETPLERLEKERLRLGIDPSIPMTYAGRLDPLAEGVLILLLGDECRNKEEYLGFDKEYEIEVLFGVKTDTGDVLGLIKKVEDLTNESLVENLSLDQYVGSFDQIYPAYSSKTVKGKALHEYAREGVGLDKQPTKKVNIYEIEKMEIRQMTAQALSKEALEKIKKVKGDFRQDEIASLWQKFEKAHQSQIFQILKVRVSCSSGTYMRSLAERVGEDLRIGALAYSIKRTKAGKFVFTPFV